MITTDPNDPNDVVDWGDCESEDWDTCILAGEMDDVLFPDDDPDTWDRCDTCAVQIRRSALKDCGGWIHEPGAWEQTTRRQPNLILHQATPHSAFVTSRHTPDGNGCSEIVFPRMLGH